MSLCILASAANSCCKLAMVPAAFSMAEVALSALLVSLAISASCSSLALVVFAVFTSHHSCSSASALCFSRILLIMSRIKPLTLAKTSSPDPAVVATSEASSAKEVSPWPRPSLRSILVTRSSTSSLERICTKPYAFLPAPPVISWITCLASARAFSSSCLPRTLSSWSEAVCIQSCCTCRRVCSSASASSLVTVRSPLVEDKASRYPARLCLALVNSLFSVFNSSVRDCFSISKLN
mmetsp:Transcript_93015/g.248958  ORF Transcript_93015/g.248958 Transcript_93015/m.248958 type:complete len:237 (+) Transcript_93015:638-1348(+)